MKPFRKICALFRRRKLEAEMGEEMRTHLEIQTQANLAAGMSREEAHYAALRSFGGVEQIKEVVREQRGWLWFEQLAQDFRYALRQLRRNPGFAAIAVLSLALGIGANTAIFSFVDEVLLKTLPVKNPGELVLFHWASKQGWVGPVSGSWETDPATKLQTCTSFSSHAFERFSDQNETLSSVFAFAPLGNVTVAVDGQAESSAFGGQLVSGSYYSGLGVPAILGRMIGNEDDVSGAAPVVVISYRYWQSRFVGDPAVVGKTISVNSAPATIIGVAPRGFLGALDVGSAPDVTLPIAMLANVDAELAGMANRPGGMWWLRVMGRMKSGVTPDQTRVQLAGVFHQSSVEDAQALPVRDSAAARSSVEFPSLGTSDGSRGLNNGRHGYTRMLMILTGLVGLVLLIACANVASLLVARGAARRREIAARLALGAGRGRLVRQLLTETGVLVLLGSVAGVILAHWGRAALLAANPLEGQAAQTLWLSPSIDWRVLGFTTALAVISALLVGLVPAWRATRVDLNREFQSGTRNVSSGSARLGRALLVVQVALALVLLVGAGLFLRTLRNLEGVDVGFDRERLLLFALNAKPPAYNEARAAILHERIATELARIPGVRAVTFSRMPLLSNAGWNSRIEISGRPAPSGRGNAAMLNAVRPDFFSTLGIPLLLGRGFNDADSATTQKVAVVNETMVRRYFDGENPVGRRFSRRGSQGLVEFEIIGVVRDAKYAEVRSQAPATFYVPFAQEASGEASFAVRTQGENSALMGSMRAVIRAIDPNLPMANLRTQDEQLDKLFGSERLFARFSSFFGVLALALVGVGLYGLMSYAVTLRTPEIGIRVALGATSRGVLWMILRESLTLVAVGAAAGMLAAAAMTRVVEKMLYGITPTDPVTFGAVTLVLGAAALVAAWVPARRATKVDPMTALRAE